MAGEPPARRWAEYALAIGVGNLAYFILFPVLPERWRHQPFALDAGLALDFVFCVVAYLGLRRWVFKRK